jgi:hypothetical protein
LSSLTGIAASRLSSSWAKALAAAGVLALAAGVAAGVVLLRGDDGAKAGRHAAVAQYIVEVNKTQQTSILELEQVNDVYRKLRIQAKPTPGQLARLEASTGTLAKLRGDIGSLAAPPEAATLRAELLKLLDVQIAIAGEVTELVRYLPLETTAQRQFAAATLRLRRDVAAAKTAADQDAAFTGFRAAILPIAARLARAEAPAVVEPSRVAEVARLRALVKIAEQIRLALVERRVKDVEALFAHFARTSGSTGTTPAERAAIVAFNRRLATIVEQRQRLSKERVRLERELG